MRVRMIARVWSKAASICSALPSISDGSTSPQCDLIAGPKNTGQASPAALSQTVMTKSGDSSACTSLDLLKSPSVAMSARCRACRLSGFTSPLGWLPALNACMPAGARWLNSASDKMLRQLLAVQRNRTFITHPIIRAQQQLAARSGRSPICCKRWASSPSRLRFAACVVWRICTTHSGSSGCRR